jgi:hypothetical protein
MNFFVGLNEILQKPQKKSAALLMICLYSSDMPGEQIPNPENDENIMMRT